MTKWVLLQFMMLRLSTLLNKSFREKIQIFCQLTRRSGHKSANIFMLRCEGKSAGWSSSADSK